jgi:hypothetical protein
MATRPRDSYREASMRKGLKAATSITVMLLSETSLGKEHKRINTLTTQRNQDKITVSSAKIDW